MILKIDLKIFMFLIIFYLSKQIEIYLVIMFFAFIHELTHLLAGILLKMKVKRISIMPLGFSVEFAVSEENYNKKILKSNILEIKRIVIAIAGPLINLIICLVASNLNIQYELKNMIIYSNFLIAIFNLLPIYPLDGGRIIKSILCIYIGRKNAIIISNKISNITLFLISFLFSILTYAIKNIALVLILIYLWYIVIKENKIFKMKIKLYNMLEKNKQIQ